MQLHKAIAAEKGSELEKYILARAAKNFYLRGQTERFDLYPFYAILVTAGITNKNLDHFDVEETYAARHSPLDKPVNLGHSQEMTCGHILDCIAVDDDLKPLKEPTENGDLPIRLHLVISAVIYKVWENPQKQAQINDIIDKISKGQIFVSMEALFRDFAYLLTHASTKEQKIIERNEKTSGLTKYLRQYKGPGRIYDYELARVLRNITFSAVGIVDKPANPESIISASLDLFSGNNLSFASDNTSLASESEQVYINIEHTKSGENNMSNEVTKGAEDGGGFNHQYRVEDHPTYQALHNEHTALKHQHTALQDDHNRLKKDHDHIHRRLEEVNSKLDSIHQKTLAEDPQGKDKPKTPVERERDGANMDDNYPNPAGTGKKKLKGPDKSTYAADDSEESESSMAENSDSQDVMKEMASLREELTSLREEKVSLAKANDALNATLDEFKKASRHSDRAEAMMAADAGLNRDKALQAVKAFDELSDAGFASMVEMMRGYAGRSPKEVTPETIMASAKAEKDAPMGASAESEMTKTIADIKNFYKSTNKPKFASAKE